MPSEFRVLMNDLVSTPPPSENISDFSPRKKKVVDESASVESTSISAPPPSTSTTSSSTTKLIELESLVTALESQLATTSASSGQYKLQIAKFEGEIKAHKTETIRLNDLLRFSQDKVIALETVVKDLTNRLTKSEEDGLNMKELYEAEKLIVKSTQEASEKSLTTLRTTHIQEIATHVSETKTLKAHVDTSKKENAILKEEIEKVKREIEKTRNELDRITIENKTFVDGLKKEIVTLKTEVTSAEQLSSETKKQLLSLQSSLRSAQNEATTSQASLELVRSEFTQKLKIATDEKTEAINRMQNAVSETSKYRLKAENAEKRANQAEDVKRSFEIALHAERASTEERLLKMSTSMSEKVEQAESRVARFEEAIKREKESMKKEKEVSDKVAAELESQREKLMQNGAKLEQHFQKEMDKRKNQEKIYMVLTLLFFLIALGFAAPLVLNRSEGNEL
jgi:CAP-Gly domain-containing linker protein 1